MLVDSHCHLDFPEYANDLKEVIARAERSGVTRMLTIGTHVTKLKQIFAVIEKHSSVYGTIGIHPHNAGEEPETNAELLIALADHPKIVGFGESGLDFFYDRSPRDRQEINFRYHIEAARETGMPLVIHTRDADEVMSRILKEEHAKGPFPGLIHCFSSGVELAELAVGLGLYISFSGIITFKNAENVREAAKYAPLDRILVETDAPFLAPGKHRGQRNEPAHVRLTAEKLAEIKGVSFEEVAKATTANFHRLFTRVPAAKP